MVDAQNIFQRIVDINVNVNLKKKTTDSYLHMVQRRTAN